MHHTESNLIEINNKIKSKINSLSLDQYNPKVIAVSKTFKEQDILPLLDYGHLDFGENKVQEALLKWSNLKERYKNIFDFFYKNHVIQLMSLLRFLYLYFSI